MAEFLQFWWQNIVTGWHLGSGIFGTIETISVIGAIILGCLQRYRHKKERWESITMKIALGLLVVSFLGSTFLVAPFLQFKDLSDKTKVVADLKMSVNSYRYNDVTKELIADVQLVNSGTTRRIVLGAMFTYRLADEMHTVADSLEDLQSNGNQSPVYVVPGERIIATFKHRLANYAPLDTPGTVFGLEIRSLTVKGGKNLTWIEAMEVVADPNAATKAVGWITDAQKIISLDADLGSNPMETQAMWRAKLPSPTPATATLPSPF
jgi:hypothetical protein